MKTCSKCNIEKEDHEFLWKIKLKGKLSPWCKGCRKQYRDSYYDKNKDSERKRIKARKEEIYSWFAGIKRNLKCERCGFSHPAALEFHHTGKDKKIKEVSLMVHDGAAIDKILTEISKCEVLCANCHKIHHFSGATTNVLHGKF